VALLFSDMGPAWGVRNGFEIIPMTEVELRVTESLRHGAPMTLIRGGEERDVAAIAAMGRVRAGAFRFHLDRDVEFVQHALTSKRLLAGLGTPGVRQVHFFIAEEGITAAAYVVLSVVGDTWAIEECGDRDPCGACVGAILQALIAREPVERQPLIRGWLPGGFVPPQVTIRGGDAVDHAHDGARSRICGRAEAAVWSGRALLAQRYLLTPGSVLVAQSGVVINPSRGCRRASMRLRVPAAGTRALPQAQA
jgi:hypothetical protein